MWYGGTEVRVAVCGMVELKCCCMWYGGTEVFLCVVLQNKFDSYLANPDSLSLPQCGLLLGTLVRSVHALVQSQ